MNTIHITRIGIKTLKSTVTTFLWSTYGGILWKKYATIPSYHPCMGFRKARESCGPPNRDETKGYTQTKAEELGVLVYCNSRFCDFRLKNYSSSTAVCGLNYRQRGAVLVMQGFEAIVQVYQIVPQSFASEWFRRIFFVVVRIFEHVMWHQVSAVSIKMGANEICQGFFFFVNPF